MTEKMKSDLKNRWQDPAQRSAIVEGQLAAWADPVKKADRVRRLWSPEARAKRKAARAANREKRLAATTQ